MYNVSFYIIYIPYRLYSLYLYIQTILPTDCTIYMQMCVFFNASVDIQVHTTGDRETGCAILPSKERLRNRRLDQGFAIGTAGVFLQNNDTVKCGNAM